MIFITAKFQIKSEYAEGWPEIAGPFTTATNSEDGCLWFQWSRSVADPEEYVLVEAFRDGESAGAHVQSAHFVEACTTLPQYLVATPKIVNFVLDQDDWSELGEMRVD